MTHRPFTEGWAAAFQSAIEADTTYREVAAKWTWPVAFVLHPAPELGFADSVAVELQLDRGRCHSASLRSPDAVTAPLVLSAPYVVWKSIVRGDLDPIAGVIAGRVTVRGPMTALMLHPAAATALLACARAIPTSFPDET